MKTLENVSVAALLLLLLDKSPSVHDVVAQIPPASVDGVGSNLMEKEATLPES